LARIAVLVQVKASTSQRSHSSGVDQPAQPFVGRHIGRVEQRRIDQRHPHLEIEMQVVGDEVESDEDDVVCHVAENLTV
jgi:hypothetical protein